jgi:lipooligosaccharide transport system permease protein
MTAPSPARSAAVLRGFLVAYRHTWRATIIAAVASPIFFFLAIGVGLGGQIDDAGSLGVPYADFVAPGILVATAMQIAATETTWPVMAGIRWFRTFHSILATPVSVADLVTGRMAWVAVRVGISAAILVAVLVPFGVLESPLAILAVPATVVTGLALAAPIEAFAATRERETDFAAVHRFVVLPMVLFAGTFFPIDELPDPLEPVAWLTPLWHGVEVCRHLMAGTPGVADAGHTAVLVAVALAGALAATRCYTRRMRP